MKTLTVTLVNHRLTFNIRVFLGAEYAVEFAGEAAALENPVLSVTACHKGAGLAQSVTAEGKTTLSLKGQTLADAFSGCCGESIGFSAWLTDSSGTVGHGQLAVNWSPVVVLDTGAVVSMTGADGADGKNAKLRVSGNYIQWQVDGDDEWTDLVALGDLKGATGPKGDKGDKGDKGAKGDPGHGLTNAAISAFAALPEFDGETANVDEMFAQVAAITAALKEVV